MARLWNMTFDPAGNLLPAFESVGPGRALGVGMLFGALFASCSMVGIYNLLPHEMWPHHAPEFLTLFLAALVPFISLAGASAVSRVVFRGKGQLGHDCFIAGASLVPVGFFVLLASILGVANIEVIVAAGVFAFCLSIFLLFAGMNRVCAISERAATIAVPVMLIATAWFSKIIYTTLLKKYIEYLFKTVW